MQPLKATIAAGGLHFVAATTAPVKEKPTTKYALAEKARMSVDPKLKAAARELRDRCLERMNGGGWPLAAGSTTCLGPCLL